MKNTKIRQAMILITHCEVMRDWFMFVDKTQRTKVDLSLNDKLSLAIAMSKNSGTHYDCIILNSTESQIISRWYLMLPEVVKDRYDIKINESLISSFKE